MTRPFGLAALLLITISACTHIDPQKAHPVQLPPNQLKALETVVTKDFVDPKSVEFRNIKARDNYYPDGKVIRSVCGEVRGKTPLGTDTGFIGFTRNLENGAWIVPAVGQPCY